jgi:lysophospholipase L1-like esterase
LEVDVDIPPRGEVVVQLATGIGGSGPGFRITDDGVEGVVWSPNQPAELMTCEGVATGSVAALTATGITFGELSCFAPQFLDGPAAIRSGLERARIALGPPPQPVYWRLLAALGGALLAGGVAFAQGRRASEGWVALSQIPLLVCLLALTWDAAVLVETLRVLALPTRQLPVLLGLLPWGLAQMALGTGAVQGRASLPVTVGLLALGGLACGLLFDAALARVYMTLFGAAVGGIVWLQRNPIRGWNLLSLALVAAALGSLEYALRWTSASQAWSVQAAEGAATLAAQFTALEEGNHTTYPSEGFPVAFGPKEGLRVVCMGGSSTGGAYQNDRLEDFYPAKLRAGDEVVNQGVGAWNSFHIRMYLEGQIEALQPDVLTLYLGVNEALAVPADLRTLHARHQAGSLNTLSVDLRLFQGFRLVVLGLRGKTEAVPPSHFEENLVAIAELAAGQGADVLLLSEAVQPRPEGFGDYKAAMVAVAASQPNVAFADSAVALQRQGASAFLDQNHLSASGHRFLGRYVDRKLREQGWPK